MHDLIISLCSFAFVLGTVPIVFNSAVRVHTVMALVYAVSLYVLFATFCTLGFWFSALASVLQAVAWSYCLIREVLRAPSLEAIE